MQEPRGSYGRCLATGDFLERFYQILFEAEPSLAAAFSGVDLEKHTELLREGLAMVILLGTGGAPVAPTLWRIARTHGPGGLDLPPEAFQAWLDCLVETVRESDPLFDAEIEAAWRSAVQVGIDFIVSSFGSGA